MRRKNGFCKLLIIIQSIIKKQPDPNKLLTVKPEEDQNITFFFTFIVPDIVVFNASQTLNFMLFSPTSSHAQ